MNNTIIIRTGTQDAWIAEKVIDNNEYRLPERFDPEDIIIDIGAHIGCFELACRQRGAKFITCYEPDKYNYDLLYKNSGAHTEVFNKAVWKATCEICLMKVPDYYTACYKTTVIPTGTLVKAIAINEILERVNTTSERGSKTIRLLKIDCEGAEVEILNAADPKLMANVQEICGEIHYEEPSKPTNAWLEERLTTFGFKTWEIIGCVQFPSIANFWGKR
jgi:FkbM family methyltransferase